MAAVLHLSAHVGFYGMFQYSLAKFWEVIVVSANTGDKYTVSSDCFSINLLFVFFDSTMLLIDLVPG